jgi:hypothetical protein
LPHDGNSTKGNAETENGEKSGSSAAITATITTSATAADPNNGANTN